MRGDWDAKWRRKGTPRVTPRTEQIEHDEWVFLLGLVRGEGRGLAGETGTQMGARLRMLERKIENRIRPRAGSEGENT